MKAIQIAQTTPATIAPDALVSEVVEQLDSRCGCALAVIEDGKLVGTLSKGDVMRKLVVPGLQATETRVAQIMNSQPLTISSETATDEALKLMTEHNQCYMPIVTKAGAVLAWLATCQIFEDNVDALTRQLYTLENFITNDAPGG